MRRKNLQARILAAVLSASMVVSMCPVTASAAPVFPAAGAESGTDTGTDTVVPEENPDSDTEEPSPGGSGSEEQGESGSGSESDAGQSDDGEEGAGTTPETPKEDDDKQDNSEKTTEDIWALMNIPYNDFYKAELGNNDVEVDAFTSATLNKTRTSTLAGGSYHVDPTGKDITGVTFPVKIPEGTRLSDLSQYKEVKDTDTVTISVTNRGQTSETTYIGKDTLFENESYAYYKLTEEPTFYKEITVAEDGSLSFGETKGTAAASPEKVTASAEFLTETSYGDYQLNLTQEELSNAGIIYGVIVHTKNGDQQGSDYGLRHMENIWQKTKLSWATGFTKDVHGCPTSSEHYKNMMGQTITGLTYYTDQGIYEVSLAQGVYVPVKFTYSLEVADASLDSGSTTMNLTGLPADYNAEYTIDGLKDAAVDAEKGTITFAKDAEKGAHTLLIHDKAGKYADLKASFILTTSSMPVVYDSKEYKLSPAENYTQEDVADYVKAIASVKVGERSYAAAGRGAVTIVNADGSIKRDADPIAATGAYKITILATGYKEFTFDYAVEDTWLLMNIPYADFYKADVKNTVDVDAFTSATLNKTRTGSLAGGSYHVDPKGSDITGVTFPVKLSRMVDLSKYTRVTDKTSVEITVTNRGQTSTTKYEGQDALFEGASYSYYVLSEAPAFYKELSVDQEGNLNFGPVQGTAKTLENAEAEFLTETGYGDYQLNLTQEELSKAEVIYGVILHTEEGSDYGLRHMENIWQKTKLSWATGFTKDVHGCPTSSEHYKTIMGQKINRVTYYTSDGIYEVPLKESVYVPVKFAYTLTVADAMLDSGSTAVELTGMPEDYSPEYTVDGLKDAAVTVADGKGTVTFAKDAANGEYTLLIHDKGNKYADIQTSFVLSTANMPVKYDAESLKLVPAEGYSQEDLEKFVKAISSVRVNETSYAASGRGAVVIINADGSLKTDAKPVVKRGTYKISVAALGYKDAVTFDYTVDYDWVLMNIPYADFYQADLNNAYPVDAFTSATLNKTRTGTLAGGSYHVNADGSDITGVIFPVKISGTTDLSNYTMVTDADFVEITVTNRGQTSTTTYKGKEALFEKPSYSYYILDEAPAMYKEVSVGDDGTLIFGAIRGEAVTLEAADAEFLTETSYGDYQLNLTCDALNEVSSIYGVVIGTEEGSDYGLRHMENIWQKTRLSWCTGFTDAVHGCPTSSAHYAKMMGQTINQVTYYTSSGIYVVPLKTPVYVPVKFNYTLTVADALLGKGSAKVKITGMPKGFDAEYIVKDAGGNTAGSITATKTKITFGGAAKGVYTLTVHDRQNIYADMQASFSLNTSDLPAAYDSETNKLVLKAGSAQADFDAYLKAITAVSVNKVSYAASGRGAVAVINADGSLNKEAAPVKEEGIYEIAVSVPGYVDLSFSYVNTAQKGLYVYLAEKEVTYTGKAIKPTVYVSYDGNVLSAKNYKVKYSNNTRVTGTPATVTVTGKGAYNGTASASFTIAGKSLEADDITVTCADVLKKGSAVPKPVVKWGKKKLSSGKDYNVTPGTPDTNGICPVTIQGTGNYSGTFETTCHYYEVKISKVKTAKISPEGYTGRLHTPKLTVTMGSSTLTEGTDYTISYINNLNKGTAKAVITGLGRYGLTKTVTFKITAKNIKDDSIAVTKDAGGKLVVMDGRSMLKEGVDYTVNKNKTTIKGKGNYTGTRTI